MQLLYLYFLGVGWKNRDGKEGVMLAARNSSVMLLCLLTSRLWNVAMAVWQSAGMKLRVAQSGESMHWRLDGEADVFAAGRAVVVNGDEEAR